MATYQPTSGRTLTLRCNVCDESFSFVTKARGRFPRFCSDVCRVQSAQRSLHPVDCKTCGRAFYPKHIARRQRERGHGLYCSLECRPQSAAIEESDLAANNRRHNQVSRARVKGAADLERIDDREIFERDGWTCRLCRKPVDKKLKAPHHRAVCINHIVPLSKGGQHTRDNLQCAHWICSSVRGDRPNP